MLYKYNMTYILFVYVISIAYKYTIYVNYMWYSYMCIIICKYNYINNKYLWKIYDLCIL